MRPAVYVPPWYIAGPIQKNTKIPNQAQVQTISKTYLTIICLGVVFILIIAGALFAVSIYILIIVVEKENTLKDTKEINIMVDNMTKEIEDSVYLLKNTKKMYTNVNLEMANFLKDLESIKKPPSFACHRTEPITSQGTITYSDCNVQNKGMNAATGKFIVEIPGIYLLSFTGLFHAENGHGVNVDIMLVSQSGRTEYLGRAATDINEVSTFFSSGTDDDIVTTATITTLYRLEKEDTIKAVFRTENDHGESKISSNEFKTIHFIGQKMSD